MELTAVLTPAEEGGYIALNPETGTTTQGETVEEAVGNLKEATAWGNSRRRGRAIDRDSQAQTSMYDCKTSYLGME